MTATELNEVNERIGRLERRLRWQTRALIACALFAVATSLLIAQTPSKRIVEAEEFILRGAQGQELADLSRTNTGASLTLFDSKHGMRAALLSSDTAGLAVVYGNDQKTSASIGVDNRSPVVQLQDEQEQTRADMAITDKGPAIRMWDSNHNIRAAIAIDKEVPILTVGSGPDPSKGSVIVTADAKGGNVLITGSDGKGRNVAR